MDENEANSKASSKSLPKAISNSQSKPNDKITNSIEKLAHKCTICKQTFANLSGCLRHELLSHQGQNGGAVPKSQKTMRNKLKAMLKSFDEGDKQTLRQEIRKALDSCAPGEELSAILKVNRIDVENMELIYARIHKCLCEDLKQIRGLKIHPFGSIASGLALKDSDIDIYIEHSYTDIEKRSTSNYRDANNEYQANSQTASKQRNFVTNANRLTYNCISKCLFRSKCFEEVCTIRQARVPIIKCKHVPTGFSLDINISCPSSVYNTQFLRDLLQSDERIHELMLFVKLWAKNLQLVGHANMTSYCLIMLVFFYLQSQHGIGSMRQLQQQVPPNVVNAVNYAYQLQQLQPIDERLSTLDLIRGFFAFYEHFQFEQNIICLYLAKSIAKQDFKAGDCSFAEYHNQLQDLSNFEAAPAFSLELESCMCVQDPFCLNLNVAKSMRPPSLDYFHKCFTHANDIWRRFEANSSEQDNAVAQLYTELLFDIVVRIARDAQLAPKTTTSTKDAATAATSRNSGANTNESSASNNTNATTESTTAAALNYTLMQTKAQRKLLFAHQNISKLKESPGSINVDWVQYSLQAIMLICTDIYALDMQKSSPTRNDKNQRMQHEHLQHTWNVSGSVDMWSSRQFQREPNVGFLQSQLKQTASFQQERRQNADYAVQLNALLIINIKPDHMAMELQLLPQNKSASPQLSNKKCHLRKFFANLKNCLQCFNLKELLQHEDIQKASFKLSN